MPTLVEAAVRIGVIKELKDQERRVALTPAGVRRLLEAGHTVMVETTAGDGAGFTDETYQLAGASIVDTEQAWDSELVVKIKEPLATEFSHFNNQLLFTFLHLAGIPATLTKALIKGKVTAIAYEMVMDGDGGYPLLAPMSAIAGNMAASVGGYYLAQTVGGKGVQLGQVLGQRNGKVLVIGDGIVGQHAARSADALGAHVYLFGRDRSKFDSISHQFSDAMQFIESNTESISEHLGDADLVIGAVLLPGDRAPQVVSREMVASMQSGSVIVDVSIDQGGCIETAHGTSHTDPVYIDENVIHYAVTNMPGAYPRTATLALTEVSLPYIQALANQGLGVCCQDPRFAQAINTHQGFITNEIIARALHLDPLYKPLTELLN